VNGSGEAEPNPSLEVVGLEVRADRRRGQVNITEQIDLRVMPGESVAIVGESGSGKSVTARAVLGLLPANLHVTGDVEIGGRPFLHMRGVERQRMRGSNVAFVMQDPFTMLNPLVKVWQQVTAALVDHRGRPLTRAARRHEAITRLADVGINDPEVLDRYPFQLSGGMRQRVAIAAAVAEDPEVLVADEPTTALDVTTQKEVLTLLDRLRRTHGMALILITHDLRVAFSTCDRVYVMYAGQIVEVASSGDVRTGPLHPYTAALIQADPPIDRRMGRLTTIPGSVPPPGQWPEGCHFAPRCAHVREACRTVRPALESVEVGHSVRCLRSAEIASELVTGPDGVSDAVDEPTYTEGDALITMRRARKMYGTNVVVAGADIDVFAGESVGLVGESGSGKTTIARMMVGLSRPDGGSVAVGGVDLASRQVTRAQWAIVRSTVQIAFQDPYSTLNPSRTIGSAIKDGLRLAGRTDLNRGVGDLLNRVGLPASHASRRPAQLSGGERQRVAIARALSRSPKVVVCDEVVSSLDVSVQAHILNLLRDLQRDLGLTYVFITHDLAVVRQVTDRVYVLHGGEIVENGPTAQVLDHPRHEYTKALIDSIPEVGGFRIPDGGAVI
jgi:peptide/nickel transport system ATP-binding protein